MAAGQLLVRSAHFEMLLVDPRLDICRQDKSQTTRKLTKIQRRLRAAEERATRLREIRPDIAKVGDRVTVEEAMRLGGYESVQKMDLALAKRTRKMTL
jgi:hypothetical protein